MNYTIPLSASVFPANFGPSFEAYQQNQVAETNREIAAANAQSAASYASQVSAWTSNALHDRDIGAKIPDKPTAPLSRTVHVDTVAVGDTVQFIDGAGAPAGTATINEGSAGTIFMWDAADGSPVGPPCPDLPAPAPVPLHAILTGNTRVMNVPPGDNTPIGAVVVDPATGALWKRTETMGPFGPYEYYLHVDSSGNPIG